MHVPLRLAPSSTVNASLLAPPSTTTETFAKTQPTVDASSPDPPAIAASQTADSSASRWRFVIPTAIANTIPST